MKDLIVAEISHIYYWKTSKWHRDVAEPRGNDGLVFFTEGEIEYFFPNRTLVAKAGDILLLPGNLPYHGVVKSKTVAFFVLDFKSACDTMFGAFGAPLVMVAKDPERLREDFFSLVSAWESQRIDAIFRAKTLIFSTLAEGLVHDETRQSGRTTSEILSYILSNYTDPTLLANKICKKFYISESQLRRNILKATGFSTNEYIATLRIHRAERELICTEKSIQQIASECGFSSAYYFSRLFRQHKGMSPKEYRAQKQMP